VYKVTVYNIITSRIRHDAYNIELKFKYTNKLVPGELMQRIYNMIFEVQGVHGEFDSKGVERSMILWDDIDKAKFNELIHYTYTCITE